MQTKPFGIFRHAVFDATTVNCMRGLVTVALTQVASGRFPKCGPAIGPSTQPTESTLAS